MPSSTRNRFPFLEGRYADAGVRQIVERVRPPLVSDGAVYRVLEKLLVLDGERISYRTLDVEQIGSVYETIMGFRMEIATGRSVAIKPAKKLGAPSTVDLDASAGATAWGPRKVAADARGPQRDGYRRQGASGRGYVGRHARGARSRARQGCDPGSSSRPAHSCCSRTTSAADRAPTTRRGS